MTVRGLSGDSPTGELMKQSNLITLCCQCFGLHVLDHLILVQSLFALEVIGYSGAGAATPATAATRASAQGSTHRRGKIARHAENCSRRMDARLGLVQSSPAAARADIQEEEHLVPTPDSKSQPAGAAGLQDAGMSYEEHLAIRWLQFCVGCVGEFVDRVNSLARVERCMVLGIGQCVPTANRGFEKVHMMAKLNRTVQGRWPITKQESASRNPTW
ncbi:hypothetical protein B0T19DRAFT_183121 [Cercophora scortea]|uniref:Uncharacterized protein n=1 Tax=Cercophora scortea TaxID=314031 RepID=A0AAE0MD68_9PEZI|nr:hypothetical protein B0T19DRAFT_183121 [Cercophora scortea]